MSNQHNITAFEGHQSDAEWYLENLGVEQPVGGTASQDEWRDYTQTVRVHMSLRRRALLKNLRDIISGNVASEVRHD